MQCATSAGPRSRPSTLLHGVRGPSAPRGPLPHPPRPRSNSRRRASTRCSTQRPATCWPPATTAATDPSEPDATNLLPAVRRARLAPDPPRPGRWVVPSPRPPPLWPSETYPNGTNTFQPPVRRRTRRPQMPRCGCPPPRAVRRRMGRPEAAATPRPSRIKPLLILTILASPPPASAMCTLDVDGAGAPQPRRGLGD